MKRMFSKLLPCLLAVLLVVGLVGCKKEEKYAHPSVEASISNGSEVFLELGQKQITNQTVYNRLVQTYGLTALVEWIDEITLANQEVVAEEFKEQLDYIIYGTTDIDDLDEEAKEKAYNAFVKQMYAQGYQTEEAWKAYYELEYKRYAFGLEKFEAYVNEKNASENEKDHLLSEEDFEIAYNTIYQNDYKAIILTFDSEYEAKQLLSYKGVDTTKLSFGWVKKDGTAYTAEEVKALFTEIHEAINPGVEAEQEYKFDAEAYRNELAAVSATINNKIKGLSALDKVSEETPARKCYTSTPIAFGSRYFLALKLSETQTYTEYKDATDEQKQAVLDYLLETAISSSFLLAQAQIEALKGDNNLTIYEEGLEIGYKVNFETNLESAGLATDENKALFATTSEESASVVAKLVYNGKTYELTADQLFARLVNKYGPALSLLYIQEYIVLSNPEYNKVTNYFTGEKLNNDEETTKLYDKYYAASVQTYKDGLAKGDYASKGFPANYGWDKFMVDYLGVSSEAELMHLYGGSLYSASEGYFIKDIYLDEEVKDEEGNVTQTKDHLVQAEMQKIFDEYYSATMIGVYAFYDKADNGIANGVAEEMTEAQEALAKELVELVYTEAKKAKGTDTLAKALEKVVKEYKSTSYTIHTNKWSSYKKAGLQLTLVSSTTYTNTSTADDAIKAEAKKQWEAVKAYKDNASGTNPNKVDAIGQTLDPGYRNVSNSFITYVTAETFGDMSEAFISKNAAYRLVITKAADHTYIKKSDSTFKPTYEQYESYNKDSSNVSSAVATAIKTYYNTAIANLTKTAIVSDTLFTETQELINANTVKFGNESIKAVTLKIIEDSLAADAE